MISGHLANQKLASVRWLGVGSSPYRVPPTRTLMQPSTLTCDSIYFLFLSFSISFLSIPRPSYPLSPRNKVHNNKHVRNQRPPTLRHISRQSHPPPKPPPKPSPPSTTSSTPLLRKKIPRLAPPIPLQNRRIPHPPLSNPLHAHRNRYNPPHNLLHLPPHLQRPNQHIPISHPRKSSLHNRESHLPSPKHHTLHINFEHPAVETARYSSAAESAVESDIRCEDIREVMGTVGIVCLGEIGVESGWWG